MLQHAYFSHLNIAAEDATQPSWLDIVGHVLDFVLEDYQKISLKDTWDGSLVHLDSSAVKIACWKLITDEWFDVIRYVMIHAFFFDHFKLTFTYTIAVLVKAIEPKSYQNWC